MRNGDCYTRGHKGFCTVLSTRSEKIMPAGQAAIVARKKQQNRAKKLQKKNDEKNAKIDEWFRKYDKR